MPTKAQTQAKSNGHKHPPTFDRLKKKKPLEATVPVCLDSALLTTANRAAVDFEKAVLEGRPKEQLEALEAAMVAAQEAANEETIVMKFKSPGRVKYEELLMEHPPTEEQLAEYSAAYGADAKAPYNGDTFGPALIALCCVEPKMTEAEAWILFEGEQDDEGNYIVEPWNLNELQTLFTTALAVCNSSRIGELGKGSGVTLNSTQS